MELSAIQYLVSSIQLYPAYPAYLAYPAYPAPALSSSIHPI